MTAMAEIPLEALVPRATGPTASVFLLTSAAAGGRTMALKVYPRPLDRRTYNGVEVEQAKLAGLRSASSIVLVQGLDELPDGRTGLRMEFCPQGLPELVSGGPLPIGDVVVLGQILATVLAEAHDIGLVHGGVTPSNVLERPSGQPALSDFGLALRLRFPRDLTAAAAYTAPEVLRDGELSEQADVYGLGATLYLALAGHSPFPTRTGETPDDVVLRVLREPVPAVSGRDVPVGLTALLSRMMAKEPADRPTAAETVQEFETLLLNPQEPGTDELDFDDFSDELAAARIAEIPTAAPVALAPAPKPQRTKGRRPPKGLLIGGGAAASLVAVLAVMLLPNDEPETAPTPVATLPEPETAVTPSMTRAVRLELKPPTDNGTSVKLEWTSSKSLVYAVHMAEQGSKGVQTTYGGRSTSMTVKVTPGLMYCFEVQGTDGTAVYVSDPQPLRGATCRVR
jgi:eukaryotic-like serine/threonine-protein kinase